MVNKRNVKKCYSKVYKSINIVPGVTVTVNIPFLYLQMPTWCKVIYLVWNTKTTIKEYNGIPNFNRPFRSTYPGLLYFNTNIDSPFLSVLLRLTLFFLTNPFMLLLHTVLPPRKILNFSMPFDFDFKKRDKNKQTTIYGYALQYRICWRNPVNPAFL